MSKTVYPRGSMGEQEQKNAKTFSIIAIVGFLVFHAAAIFLSSAPFTVLKNSPVMGIIPALAVLMLVACIYGRSTEKDWADEQKWPYILLIVLSMASAVVCGYNPAA